MREMKKWMKRILSFSMIVCMLLVGTSVYIGYRVMNPERKDISELPSDWDLSYEDIEFTSKDGVTLEGWWIPSQKDHHLFSSKKTVVFAHGYGYNRAGEPNKALKLAHKLSKEGYNTLLFDFRNSGESGNAPTTIGKDEQYDLLAAIKYAKEHKESNKIALLGWSMGAATSILTANESKDVVSVIADSPFSSLDGYLSDQFEYWTGAPNFLSKIVITINEELTPLQTKDVNPMQAVQSLKQNLLLIHGKHDGAISYTESIKLYEKANPHSDTTLWVPRKGGHIRTYKYQQRQYEKKVVSFLNDSM